MERGWLDFNSSNGSFFDKKELREGKRLLPVPFLRVIFDASVICDDELLNSK